ncbi:MAG TPA: tetratricopeptide repeat protein [Gemmataceae bacterium]|nr:tetratricopeptide repeat protein [Gemmataceae bacterium]
MEKANPSRPSSPAGVAPTTAAAPTIAPPIWRRRRLVLGILLILGLAAGGWWAYQGWKPRVAAIPEIDLADVDPEIGEAISKARADVRAKPRSEEAWGKLAMVLHAHGFYDQAFACYGTAADLDAKDPRWPYLQGLIATRGEDPFTAIPYLEKAAELTQADSLPTAKLGGLLMTQGRFDEAEARYRRVLKERPDSAYANLGLAQLAMTRQQYKDALRYAEPVAENPIFRKRVSALRVAAYERLGDHAAADAERKRMLTLPEDAAWPDAGLDQVSRLQVGLNGRLKQVSQMAQQGHLESAVSLLKSTVEAYPNSHTAWGFLGKGLGDMKDYAGAEEAFQKAIALAPSLDKAEHWYYVGFYRQEQRKYKEAADAYLATVELRPQDAQAHFSLGECLEASGDRKGAADAYREALRHRPGMASARDRLANLTKQP